MSIFPPQGFVTGGSKPGSLLVTSNTTLQGSNVYVEVYVTNNATLTLAPGTTLIASHIVIDTGATLQLQGATIATDTFINEGTLSSTSANDQITVNDTSKIGGSISLVGKMILQQLGNFTNHILVGTISGSGTLEINGIMSIASNNTTLNVDSITVNGALEIPSGNTLIIGGNVMLSGASITGTGTLEIANGSTLTLQNTNISNGIIFTGSGTLNIGSGVAGGSVPTGTKYWGFYANSVSQLPLQSLNTEALLLFSPNQFSAGAGGSTSLPANTYYITLGSGSSLTVTSSVGLNFGVVATTSSWSVNTGSTTVNAFSCSLVNGTGSASGSVSVTAANTCSGFVFF